MAELLRLRVAQVNACPYCLDVHHRAARDAGIPEAKIRFLAAWQMLEIVGVVVNMNVWTRVKLAQGAMPAPDG